MIIPQELLNCLQRHWEAMSEEGSPTLGLNDGHVVFASFIDPRLKGVHLRQENLFTWVKLAVVRKIKRMEEENNSDTDNNLSCLTPTLKLMSSRGTEDDMNIAPGYVNHAGEVEVYLKLSYNNEDLLVWWKNHSKVLP